jgi:hypothetical protein
MNITKQKLIILAFVLALTTFIGVTSYSFFNNNTTNHTPTTTSMQQNSSMTNIFASVKNRIAIVEPTFTEAAYNNAFYIFYDKYDSVSKRVTVTTDLNYLHSSLDILNKQPTKLSMSNIRSISILKNLIEHVLPNSTITTIKDQNINDGILFLNGTTNAYDILFVLHEEYLTQKMYDSFKHFVANGGTVVFLDGNIFYAKVDYDNNTITLIKGHRWEFDGHVARKSVDEYWLNQTKEWVGGNYWESKLDDKVYFKNNIFNYPLPGVGNETEIGDKIYVNNKIFNYTHWEETYVNNPKDVIILDYGADYTTYKVQHKVATYVLLYGKGEVVNFGLYTEKILKNERFQKFFESVITTYCRLC